VSTGPHGNTPAKPAFVVATAGTIVVKSFSTTVTEGYNANPMNFLLNVVNLNIILLQIVLDRIKSNSIYSLIFIKYKFLNFYPV